MEKLLKVKLIDTETNEALISPSGNDYFMLDRLPLLDGVYTYMKPFAPQKYIVGEISKLNNEMFEVKMIRS